MFFVWNFVKDGDVRAYSMFKRHYSFEDYKDGRRRDQNNRNRHLFVGPGKKIVLMTQQCDALIVWRKFIDKSGQQGVNCAIFRNESKYLSSELILEAEKIAWEIFPGERLYTYVNPRKIRSSNPGYCFLKAGWRKLDEKTKSRKLIILEKLPYG